MSSVVTMTELPLQTYCKTRRNKSRLAPTRKFYSWQRIESKSVAVRARLRLLAIEALLILNPESKSSGTMKSSAGVGDGGELFWPVLLVVLLDAAWGILCCLLVRWCCDYKMACVVFVFTIRWRKQTQVRFIQNLKRTELVFFCLVFFNIDGWFGGAIEENCSHSLIQCWPVRKIYLEVERSQSDSFR